MKSAAYGCIAVIAVVSAGFNLQRTHAQVPAQASRPEADASRLSSSGSPAATPERSAAPTPPRLNGPLPAGPAGASPVARPPRRLRVALQAGHWKAAEAPDELAGLRDNGGTRGGGRYEWEVNLEIAQTAADLLREAGYEVEVLPATVPERYQADLFVAIHADGNDDSSVHGYRVAAPRRDATRQAQEFADVLAGAYGEATGIRRISTVTRRMRGYYAFNSRRYQHAIAPTTVGVIIETGFLTSPTDRRVLIGDPSLAARGIFDGVSRFLGPPTPTTLVSSTSRSE